jgi:hypothetical protein
VKLLFLFALAIAAQNFTDLDALDQAVAEKAAADERLQAVQRCIVSDTTVYVGDTIREVYVQDTVVLMAIEQIDDRIESLRQLIYNDKPSRKILALSVDDQIRYLDYLIKYEIKSRPDAITLAQQLTILIDYQVDKTKLLLDTQQGNNRARVFLHVKKMGDDKGKILSYIKRKSHD